MYHLDQQVGHIHQWSWSSVRSWSMRRMRGGGRWYRRLGGSAGMKPHLDCNKSSAQQKYTQDLEADSERYPPEQAQLFRGGRVGFCRGRSRCSMAWIGSHN